LYKNYLCNNLNDVKNIINFKKAFLMLKNPIFGPFFGPPPGPPKKGHFGGIPLGPPKTGFLAFFGLF
jgi:hypothetical protein